MKLWCPGLNRAISKSTTSVLFPLCQKSKSKWFYRPIKLPQVLKTYSDRCVRCRFAFALCILAWAASLCRKIHVEVVSCNFFFFFFFFLLVIVRKQQVSVTCKHSTEQNQKRVLCQLNTAATHRPVWRNPSPPHFPNITVSHPWEFPVLCFSFSSRS